MKRFLTCGTLLLLFGSAIAGCGDSSDSGDGPGTSTGDDSPSTPAVEVVEEPVTVPLNKLVPVEYGGLGIALDNGRVVVPTPTGWAIGNRMQSYLIWFKATAALIPHIYVTAEDAVEGAEFTLTNDNVVDFAKSVKQRLEETGQQTDLLERKIRPLIIGEVPCVRYVIKDAITVQSAAKTEVEKQMLLTVHKGRQYTVALRVNNQQDLLKHKDAAYAVLAGLQFQDENANPTDN